MRPAQTKKILRSLIALGLLAVFFWFAPVGEVYRAVLSADLPLFTSAMLLGFPGVFLTTLNTWILARRQGINVALFRFYEFNLSLRFYGFFSPASAVATAIRWYKLSAGNKKAEALSAIALTRLLSIFVAVSLGLFWVLADVNQNLIHPGAFALMFGLILLGWLTLARCNPFLTRFFDDWSQRLTRPWLKRLSGFLGRFFKSMDEYARMPLSILLLVVFFNLVNELLGLLAYLVLARALHLPISLADLGWVRSLSFLAALAPFTLPGGVGLREVTLLLVISAFDISPGLAAAYSFLNYARGVIFALLCGVIEFISSLRQAP